MTLPQAPARTDVLVVGAGPAGAAAAAWAARGGRDVVLADAAVFPRDKTCGDGLTPRAIAELQLARTGRLGACAHDEPGPAGARVRADAAPALARRQPARLRLGGAAHGARRPPAHDGDEVRGGRRGRCPRGRRTTRRRPGGGGGLPAATASASRSAASSWWSPTESARRSARCWAASGTATRRTASPRGPTCARSAPTTSGSARTSSCATWTTRSCPATAGSSRSATAR